MTKRVGMLTVYVLCGGCTLASAQQPTQTSQLQPSAGVFAEHDFFLDYYLAVRRTLLPGWRADAEFLAVALPSFAPEWALFMHTPISGRRTIELRVIDGQIWTALQAGEDLPGFTAYTNLLDQKIAATVIEALVHTLRRTTYPKWDSTVGTDGTTYHFSSFVLGEGILAGQVWSPEDSTPAGKLVSLVETLRRFVVSPPDDPPASERDIHEGAIEVLKVQE